MAIAFVGGTTNSINLSRTGGWASLPLTYSPTAGNMIVVGANFYQQNYASETFCQDQHGNILPLLSYLTYNGTNNNATYLFAGPAVTGATTYTVYSINSAIAEGVLAEYSGAYSVANVGSSSSGWPTSSGATAAISLTSIASGSLVVAEIAMQEGLFSSPYVGTLRESVNQLNANCSLLMDNPSVTAGSLITCSALDAGGVTFWGVIAAEILPQGWVPVTGVTATTRIDSPSGVVTMSGAATAFVTGVVATSEIDSPNGSAPNFFPRRWVSQ